jgi:hypothetical protein
VIVRCGEDLLVGAKSETAVKKPQSHGGTVGERYLSGANAKIVSRRGEYRDFGFALILEPVFDGIRIELGAVKLNGIAHGFWMGRQEKARHMDQVGRQNETAAHILPAQAF